MVRTNQNQKQFFTNKFSQLFAAHNTRTSTAARKFIVAICWVGYYTAAVFAVVLFVPTLLVKAAKIAVKVTKEGRA